MSEQITLRPEVQWFAEQMELTLRNNDHKGGWKECDTYWLLSRLDEEKRELRDSMLIGSTGVISEATDVANFALMIADLARSAIVSTEILSEAEAEA